MTQSSYPFDNLDTTETQFSYWAKNLSGNGYGGVAGVPGDSTLKVATSASGLVVTVTAGFALVRGFAYSNDATVTLTLNTATQNRYDRIVLRLDPSANTIVLAVVTGTGAVSPTLPALTQTDTGIYEMELANIYIPAGAVLSTSGTLTDTRTFLGEQTGKWSVAGRPTAPMIGRLGYNTDLAALEVWSGTAWVSPIPTTIDPFLLMGA